jgi:hypothetical protein
MDMLGTLEQPVITGFSAGLQFVAGPNQQVVNLSQQSGRIGDGTQRVLYEFFVNGLGLSPSFDLRFEGNDAALCTPSGQPDLNRGVLQFTGFTFPGHVPFNNEPAVAGVTPLRASDITELRARINSLRARVQGLGSFVYSDSVTVGSPILPRMINETRQALTDVYLAFGLPAPTFTDTLVSGTTGIKAIHIQELRNLTGNLE